MSTKSDSVTAWFGGAERVFRYPRQPVRGIVGQFHDRQFSPFATLERLGGGTWTIDDVVRVLSPHHDTYRPYSPDPDIVAVLIQNGPGNYAPLAGRVLEAALFGVEADKATFDERHPFASAGGAA